MPRILRSRWTRTVVIFAALALVLSPLLLGGTHAATPTRPQQVSGPGGNGSGGGHHKGKQQNGQARPVARPAGINPKAAPRVASNTWVPLAPTNFPSGREAMAMATDATRGKIVLFGGTTGCCSSVLNDTWIWDGTNWTQVISPGCTNACPNSPPARFGQRMAFDPSSGDVLLFGGYDGNRAPLGDTWLWNGSSWLPQLTRVSPTPRGSVGLATDTRANGVVLFGGDILGDQSSPNNCYESECTVGDTWIWTGGQWHQGIATTMPSSRKGATMATQANGQAVLLGGQMRGGQHEGVAGDTWLESNGTWTQQSPFNFPYPRQNAGFAPTNFPSQGLLLFAGKEHDYNSPVTDTWLYAGGVWTQLNPDVNPPHGRTPAMATDPTTGTPLLFMGNDTNSSQDSTTWRWGQ